MVTVTAPLYSSDSRMRWLRYNGGPWMEYYPGRHPRIVTAEYMDRCAGAVGYVETCVAPWVPD